MREIEFRVWNKQYNRFMWKPCIYKNIYDLCTGYGISFPEIYIFQQYTGLKDKNGKKIYEGDLLIHFNDKDAIFECFYHDGDGCFSIARAHYINSRCGGYVPTLKSKNLTIIGNIYENKELFETKCISS